MEIKNFEPSVDINENGRNLVSEACKWIGALFTMKVKEKGLEFITAKRACNILNEIRSCMLFTQECNNKANNEDRVVDIAIDLVDIMINNYEVASKTLGEDYGIMLT